MWWLAGVTWGAYVTRETLQHTCPEDHSVDVFLSDHGDASAHKLDSEFDKYGEYVWILFGPRPLEASQFVVCRYEVLLMRGTLVLFCCTGRKNVWPYIRVLQRTRGGVTERG
jgi:hypothetical protein